MFQIKFIDGLSFENEKKLCSSTLIEIYILTLADLK